MVMCQAQRCARGPRQERSWASRATGSYAAGSIGRPSTFPRRAQRTPLRSGGYRCLAARVYLGNVSSAPWLVERHAHRYVAGVCTLQSRPTATQPSVLIQNTSTRVARRDSHLLDTLPRRTWAARQRYPPERRSLRPPREGRRTPNGTCCV